MTRKPLGSLHAVMRDGAVHLTVNRKETAPPPGGTLVFRVYRREAAEFTFGQDGAEFFDGADWRDAERVFEGPLEIVNKRTATYRDDSVAIGRTYAYWMALTDGEPVGPAPVKVRDPEIWWPYQRIVDEIAALQRDFPDQVRVERLGYSAQGRDILGVRVGAARPAVALIGVVHPGESGPELILPAMRNVLAGHQSLLARVGVLAIPVVNVDERERIAQGVPWYLRTNAAGVDLNRNFPAHWDETSYSYGLDSSQVGSLTYRGPRPASEPETQAVMAFISRHRPVAVYSFHCLASICGGRLLAARIAEGDPAHAAACAEFATTFAAAMAPKIAADMDDVISFRCTSGSLPAWCCLEGIPAFDLEILRKQEIDELQQCLFDRTDRALLAEYQERHTRALVAVLRKLGEL